MAAGGPLVAPGTDAFVLTALVPHGGSRPPLVAGANAELRLQIVTGHGGARLEVDGRVFDTTVDTLTIGYRRAVAKIVEFDGQEPLLTGLRRRLIIMDSPRILADDVRD
jgi:NAD+ kinase